MHSTDLTSSDFQAGVELVTLDCVLLELILDQPFPSPRCCSSRYPPTGDFIPSRRSRSQPFRRSWVLSVGCCLLGVQANLCFDCCVLCVLFVLSSPQQ